MSRPLTKWVVAGVLGGLGWVAATPADAQFMPGGVPPGMFVTTPFGSYGVTSSYNIGYNYTLRNPYNGGVYNYRGGFFYNGWPPPTYGGGGYAGYPAARYNGAWTGNYSNYPATNPIVQQQLRMFASARTPAGPAAGPAAGDQWAARQRPADVPPADKLTGVDAKLINAPEEEVLSGKALNALAAAARDLEKKGAKAEPPLFPTEVVDRIAYAKSDAAELLAAVRAGKPQFPRPLADAKFADLRTDLEKHYLAVTEPLVAGRQPGAAVDRLDEALGKAEKAVAPAASGLSAADAAEATTFLGDLKRVAKLAKNADLAGVAAPAGNGVGMTAADLLRHKEKFKLEFAAAPAGAGGAYHALHRGLAAYYVGLAQARR